MSEEKENKENKKEEFKKKIKKWKDLEDKFILKSKDYRKDKPVDPYVENPKKIEELRKLGKDILENYNELLDPGDKARIKERIKNISKRKEKFNKKMETWKKLENNRGTAQEYKSGKDFSSSKFNYKKRQDLKKLSKELLDDYEEFLNPSTKHEIREILS